MIKYYDGRVDKRVTLRTSVSGGYVSAVQMNPDGSTEFICYDDLEYGREVREADVIVDATDADYKLEATYNAHKRLGLNGIHAHVGDICEVIRGKKYPINLQFKVTKSFRYYVPNTYDKIYTDYLCFEQDGKEERIPAKNVKIVDSELLQQRRMEEAQMKLSRYRVYIEDTFGSEYVEAFSLKSAAVKVKARLLDKGKKNKIERITKYCGCRDGEEDWQDQDLKEIEYLIPEIV